MNQRTHTGNLHFGPLHYIAQEALLSGPFRFWAVPERTTKPVFALALGLWPLNFS
jgi:hypothetical protein